MSVQDRLVQSGPKRLLALDGGGIRGMVTIEILAHIEHLLRDWLGQDSAFVLADYFDYVGGTSTGAIIATCIAMGMSIDQIRTFYIENGTSMFDKASLFQRLRYKFDDEPLAQKLKAVLGAHTTLGDDKLRTLLMLVMRNATTDSPWPVSNNPQAKYNDRTRSDCNLALPLWQLVRASTAAPTYFPPEIVQIGTKAFIFVDGGVTPYNNPAFLLFLMATVKAYRLQWPTGEDRMLLVSVGTGMRPDANASLQLAHMNLLYHASTIPAALMFAANNEQDMLCRVFGQCRAGARLDREIDTLMESSTIQVESSVLPKLFTYMRYNADLSREGLDALGLGHIRPEDVQQLDTVDHMEALQEVGRAVATHTVKAEHFQGFISQA